MRKFYQYVVLLAAVVMAACDSDTTTDNERLPNVPLTFRAEMNACPNDRVSIEDNCYHWVGDETLGVYVASATPTRNAKTSVTLDESGVAYCSTTVNEFAAADVMYLYMPYSQVNNTADATAARMCIPSEQSVEAAGELCGDAMPMVGNPYLLSEGEQAAPVRVRPLGGLLCFNLYASGNYAGENVVSVSYSTTTPLAGDFTADLTAGLLTITGYDEKCVTVTLDEPYTLGSVKSAAEPIYMVVAPGDYVGEIVVTTDKAEYRYDYSRTVERNKYYNVNANLSSCGDRTEFSTTQTAMLTYEEAHASVSGYNRPTTYTNTYGEWTICCYDNSAFQINDGKVAYIGTPEFSGAISAIDLTFKTSFSGSIYLCTESGSTTEKGIVQTEAGPGKTSMSITLDNPTAYKQLFIRSEGVCYITSVTVTYGGLPSSGGGTEPEPEPEPEVAPTFILGTPTTTGVTASDAKDGRAQLSAEITYTGKQTITETGIAYKTTTTSDYTFVSCGTTLSPSTTLTALAAGSYNYYAYAVIGSTTYQSDASTFVIEAYSAPADEFVATLTFEEAQSYVSGYDSPQTYTNAYGAWTICCHKTNFQLNGGKVAYIGTPVFASPIRKVKLDFSESYTGKLYLCTEKGAKTATGVVKTFNGGGDTATCEITDADYKQLYLRSENCARITAITITCGGSVTTPDVDTTSEPSFSSLRAAVTPATSAAKADGKATLSASITYTGAATVSETGFGYRLSTGASFTSISCDTSLSPSASLTSLAVGSYTYYAYAIVDGVTYKSGETSFTIADSSVVPQSKFAWAELPVMYDTDDNGVCDKDNTLYYASHLCAGGEKNAQRTGTARNFTVCYSSKYICPLWVAAPRHSMYVGSSGRNDSYKVDPKIPSGVQYSSKNTGGGCNKGHMVGSAERTSSVATNKQVFYYSNIAPQYSDTFNTGGGAWNNLEDYVDGLVCSDTLYTVIGCYFDSFSKNGASASPSKISFGGRSNVSCPTMFYYALLRTKKGNTGKRVQDCSADELQCVAFTICHKMTKGHKPAAGDMMSISDLEALTGVKYFPNVPNAPKGTFTASDWL